MDGEGQMQPEIEQYDRAVLFPLRRPLIVSLILFSLAMSLARVLPARQVLPWVVVVCGIWLFVCGAVIRALSRRGDWIEWRDLVDVGAIREAFVLGLVSFLALSPLFFLSLLQPACAGEDIGCGAVAGCMLAVFVALGVGVAIWLPAVALMFAERKTLVNLVRIDQHFATWVRAGGRSVKYWGTSLAFLIIAGSIWDLEIFLWWPDVQVLRIPLSAAAFSYWTLVSIWLARSFFGEFGEAMSRAHSIR